MASIAKNTLATALLVASLTQSVAAQYNRNCYYDNFGRYRCRRRGLFGGSLAGAIVGAVAGGLLLILLFVLCFVRRRRSRRANEAYVNQPAMAQTQPVPGSGYYGQQYGQQPQYNQQQSYGAPAGQGYSYNNGEYRGEVDAGSAPSAQGQATYAPPSSPPPAPAYEANKYSAPPGPPPAAHTANGGEASSYYGTQRQGGGVV